MLAKPEVQGGGSENEWYLPQRKTRDLGREVGPKTPCYQASCSMLYEVLSFSVDKKDFARKHRYARTGVTSVRAGSCQDTGEIQANFLCLSRWATAVAQG